MFRAGALQLRAIRAVTLERDDACAAPRDRLLERGLDDVAVGIFRQHGGERSLAGAHRMADDALDVGLRQEAQQIDTAAGDARIRREGDHRDVAATRDLRGTRHRKAEQRPEDDFRALIDRLLRRALRALRAAAVVLDQELDVRALELDQRQFGGVAHRLRRNAGIARARQRQEQPDADRPGADRGRLLRRTGGRRRRTRPWPGR